MATATDTVNELRDLAQEIVDNAEELLEIREAGRGEYTPEDKETALDEFESSVRKFYNTIPDSLKK